MDLNVPSIRPLLKALYKYDFDVETDYDLLEFCIEEKQNFVRHYCNIQTIPECMNTEIIKMIMGEFLYQKFSIGGPEAIGAETTALVSSITEDDTTVDFDSSKDKSRNTIILEYLDYLRNGGDRVFLRRHRSVTPKK